MIAIGLNPLGQSDTFHMMKKTTIRNICIGAAALVILMVILPKSAPRDPVEDPAAYLREKFPEVDLRHWIDPYLDWSPENLDRVVADFAEKEKKLSRGELPNDPKKLDRLLSSALPSYFVKQSISTPDGREQILEKARARLADPPMTMTGESDKGYAVVDFWVVPGAWKRPLRQAFEGELEMQSDGVAFDSIRMKPEFFRQGLKMLSARFPDARAYDIRARIPEGRSSSLVRIVYFSKGNRFERDDGGAREFARGPEGGMEALLDGSADISTLKFATLTQGDDSPGYTLPPAREPLEGVVRR